MANLCSNEVHITCAEEDLDTIKDYMTSTFSDVEMYFMGKFGDESQIEFYFNSKWTFPDKEMESLVKACSRPGLFHATCLSVEWGTTYCAFHKYEGDGWNIVD